MVVTAKDFRARQSTYIGYAQQGEDVIVKSRAGSVRLIPIEAATEATTLDSYEEAMARVKESELRAIANGETSPRKTIEESIKQGKNISVEQLFHVLVCDIKDIYDAHLHHQRRHHKNTGCLPRTEHARRN